MTHLSVHCGNGGNHNGLGVFLDQMAAAGFRPWLKSADSYGPLIDATRRGGVGVFRLSTSGQGTGFDFDVPNYFGDPATVAAAHWAATKAKLPPEFDKANVWLEVINEVDKNQAAFLGAFATYIAMLANADGYKVLMFSFSSGEPEPKFWEHPHVLEYLRYCEDNPHMAGVALHEYNYGHRAFADVYPHHVGRFQWLYDTCNRHNIARPLVAITEWGFSQDRVPTWDEGRAFAEACFSLYSRYAIDGPALWCLQAWPGNVENETNAFMKGMAPWLASVGPQQGDRTAPLDPAYFEPLPPQQTLEQAIWEFGLANQVIDTNADAAIEQAIGRDGFFQIGDEKWLTFEGERYATQPAYNAADGAKRVYWAKVPQWHDIHWTDGQEDPEPPIEPAPQIDFLPYFLPRSADAWMLQTSWGPQEKVRGIHDAASRTFRHVKNSNWERLHYDGNYIYRSVDTSPGPDATGKDRYYSIADSGLPYSRWLMRYGRPGDWFERLPTVRFYYKQNCQPITSYTDHSWLNVVAIHAELRFALTGVAVRNVLELAWANTRGGPPIERYWYAGGLVGWLNVGDGRNSAIASYTVGDNQPEVIPCL